jgi:hypothetical protein
MAVLVNLRQWEAAMLRGSLNRLVGTGAAFLARSSKAGKGQTASREPQKLPKRSLAVAVVVVAVTAVAVMPGGSRRTVAAPKSPGPPVRSFDQAIERSAQDLLSEGRRVFRRETFGDQAFWGGTLRLHEALKTVTPLAALTPGGVQGGLGLKVDVDQLPSNLVNRLRRGQVDLDDPAVTLALLKLDAVVGVTGFFGPQGDLMSVGFQCAVCHSTVDNSLTFGIGHRLDGWANRDLDIGKIIASAPNLEPIARLLGTDVATVSTALLSWGPGKFDAQLLLDGQTVNPNPVTRIDHGVLTAVTMPGATLIPNAFGLAGFNQHTWTGPWGTVTYWNAFVANLELMGIGRFFDPRLFTPQFPIAIARGAGNRNPTLDPERDEITRHLAALHFYQLAIPSPKPRAGIDFDLAAAQDGNLLFSGKAKCNMCHVKPLWTEPGWNLHPSNDLQPNPSTPPEFLIDDFQANRAPRGAFLPDGTPLPSKGSYKTMNLAGLFVRENGLFMAPENAGRFYHDGRFRTLKDVVISYNVRFALGLSDGEMNDLVEYLKSLFSNGSAVD